MSRPPPMTPEEYESTRKRYANLIQRIDEAQARRDYRTRAALAAIARPLEDDLNAYELAQKEG